MGFFNNLGKAASAVGSSLKESVDEINELESSYNNESNEYLKNKVSNGNYKQKAAAAKVLKSRGQI